MGVGRSAGLVSVVVPAYNAEQFLGECLESVASQTYSSWEVIVVNDGSTDGTAEAAEGFRARFPAQTKLVTTDNQGLSSARNNGLAVARGEFIAFLDSDDLWMPDKLNSQLARLSSEPGSLATSCSFVRFDGNDSERQALHHFEWSPASVRRWLLMEGPGPALGSTLMVRAETLQLTGQFDSSLGSHAEDLDFACRLVAVGCVLSSKDVVVAIRVWPGQIHGDDEAMRCSLVKVMQRNLARESHQGVRAGANLVALMAIKRIMRGEVKAGFIELMAVWISHPVRVPLFVVLLARKRRVSRLRIGRGTVTVPRPISQIRATPTLDHDIATEMAAERRGEEGGDPSLVKSLDNFQPPLSAE